jgi:hypothetical protein
MSNSDPRSGGVIRADDLRRFETPAYRTHRTDWRALAVEIGRASVLRAYRVEAGFYVYEVAAGIGATPDQIHRAEDGEEDQDDTITEALAWIVQAGAETRKKEE